MAKEYIQVIQDIGEMVDILDISLNEDDIAKIDVSLAKDIEEKLDSLDYDSMSDDEAISYLYTKSNYLSVLNRLVLLDFKMIKEKLKRLNKYETLQNLIFESYSERIGNLRTALKRYTDKSKISKVYVTQVMVNLGNVYREMGRIIESIEALNIAKQTVKEFPMALGNHAIKHYSLAMCCTDKSTMRYLLDNALIELEKVFKEGRYADFISSAQKEIFKKWEMYLKEFIDVNLYDVSPWTDDEDVADDYKNWSAKRQLSLNYINVLYMHGNVDTLHIPNMGISYFNDDRKLTYYSWFNTIKQEYNMARYYLYCVDKGEYYNGHESQRYNVIVNTLDYPAIGYKTELIKSALKTSYGVLDKIGLFCCHFHKLKVKPSQVDFHKWYKEIEMELALKSPFKALYWLSQDLDFSIGELKEIRRIRNVIEHRYVRVLDSYTIPLSEELNDSNKFEYVISYNELEETAYDTLKLARCAIFYMVNGFNVLFNQMLNNHDSDKIFIPLILDTYDDEWKN